MKRALVLSLAVIFGLGIASFAQSLSGEFTVDVLIDLQESDFALALDFSSTLSIIYEVGGWAFTSYSVFNDGGWFDQTFAAAGALGAWTFDAGVDFDPTGAFDELTIGTSIALGGMTFGFDFTLADMDTTLVLMGSGSTSLVDIELAVTFGGDDNDICDLNWGGLWVGVSFPFCCADVYGTIEFDCNGFVQACFGVTDVVVGAIPYLTLDATVCFQSESKTLVLSPNFDFGADICFDVYFDVVGGQNGMGGPVAQPLTIGSIEINGIGLECEIGGVSFTGISYWGTGTKPGILKGTEYWEAYQISTIDEGCCGPFGFDIGIYFSDTSTSLFDVALISASMSLEVASQFTFNMGIEYDVLLGASLWTLGFVVTW